MCARSQLTTTTPTKLSKTGTTRTHARCAQLFYFLVCVQTSTQRTDSVTERERTKNENEREDVGKAVFIHILFLQCSITDFFLFCLFNV